MKTLIVLMRDARAGTLMSLPNGRVRFEYDSAYRAAAGSTPLSLSMPLEVPVHADQVVTPWLWGLLPDNDAVLARWGRHFHVSASSPFALLSTPVGEDCAGAVRFCPETDVGRLRDRKGTIDWLDGVQVAQRLRDLRQDATTWLGRTFTGQFSLAGAQAKTALYHDGRRWGIPSGATPTTHILKPAVTGFDDHDLNEHLCLDAARRAGLRAVRTRVERFEGETAIVVTRYDRLDTDDGVIRVHQEDLCQALAVHPRDKYQAEGGPSPRDIIRLFRRTMPARIADEATWSFVDAIIWNWLIAGTDAHAKNYSVLLAAGDVRLAPLYDIASALPYGTHERKLRMAMKVGGDYDLVALRDRWSRAATEWDMDRERLASRVSFLASATLDAFAAAAADPAVVALERPGPPKLVDAVANRVARIVRGLS
ncbi:MAG: type II toxin-antitoxin system HipA family toxin [Chloroflexota bacterium]|nr:type II toxin-antitoxin system HipA family toxin [Chloroflexota bacterium]